MNELKCTAILELGAKIDAIYVNKGEWFGKTYLLCVYVSNAMGSNFIIEAEHAQGAIDVLADSNYRALIVADIDDNEAVPAGSHGTMIDRSCITVYGRCTVELLPDVLVMYAGGGYDGCIWEYNYFLRIEGEFMCIHSSGSMGARDSDKKMADVISLNERRTIIIDLTDETAVIEFCSAHNAGVIAGIDQFFATLEESHNFTELPQYLENYELKARCFKCKNAMLVSELNASNPENEGGIAVSTQNLICYPCRRTKILIDAVDGIMDESPIEISQNQAGRVFVWLRKHDHKSIELIDSEYIWPDKQAIEKALIYTGTASYCHYCNELLHDYDRIKSRYGYKCDSCYEHNHYVDGREYLCTCVPVAL